MKTSGQKLTSIAAALALMGHALTGTLLSTSAFAADMLDDVGPEYTDVEFGTGWYLRGDVSLTAPGGLFQADTSVPIPGTTFQQMTVVDTETVLTAGVAIGHRLSKNLRIDLGLESLGSSSTTTSGTTTNYRPPCSNAFARTIQTNPLGGTTIVVQTGHTITNCVEESSSAFDMNGLGGNLFYDFDSSFLGARPFIGAGLGVVRNTFTNETGTITCTAAAEERCNPTDGGVTDFGESHSQVGTRNNGITYHASASISAGLSFAVSDNMYIDTSYRYTHLFETPIFGGAGNLTTASAPTSLHALKVGLRYEIW